MRFDDVPPTAEQILMEQRDHNPSSPERRPYQTPQLQELGTISEQTQGTAQGSADFPIGTGGFEDPGTS
ncbi:MAG: lasso RiPP family leader peptide-containing protein [Bacteroidetes bacterium]|jgi:hypothetical protein|nr:lasso RiPP family leader peptide-containing protein [Bacteroidota bacterium]